MVHAGNAGSFVLQFFAVFRLLLGNSRVWRAQFFFAVFFFCFSLFFAVFRFFLHEPLSKYH